MENPVKAVNALIPIEELAEEILRDKSEVIALDKRRNENRIGLRALEKLSEKKVWITIGPVLLKLPRDKTKNLLLSDYNTTEFEINKIRSELKVKVNKLRDLEFQEPIPGLHLKPMSQEEFNAIGQILGHRA